MELEQVKSEVLDNVKETYTITGNERDKYINNLIANTFNEYLILTGDDVVKDKFLFVIEGVVTKRYARRGNEAMSSVNLDGFSVNYEQGNGDFSEYYGVLSTEYELKTTGGRPARVVIF